jgi:hypothetical protein
LSAGFLAMRFRFEILLVSCFLYCTGFGWAQATSQNDQSTSQPTPELSAPQTPPTLADMPSQLPTVTYQSGKLTIVAKNSTLKDILQAVCDETGAKMDIPEEASERVVLRLGPGSPRDVLASLLNGSSFNYVMLGSVEDPSSLVTVVLTPKPGEKDTAATNAGLAAGNQPGHPAPSILSTAAITSRRALLQQQVLIQQQQLAQSAAASAGDPIETPKLEEAPSTVPSATADAVPAPESPQPPPGESHDSAAKDNTPKTPMQTLQDLYAARYQMIREQAQPKPQQQDPPPQPQQDQPPQ